jgi:hypothetical protein
VQILATLTSAPTGFDQFLPELNASVVRDILAWRDHPELGRMLATLQSHTNRKAFFDTYAEAIVARHLIQRGCALRFEVANPQGRRCDFEVSAGERKFYLHVKRLDTDRPPRHMLAVSSRLRMLERIARPYVVQVRWQENLTDDQMQRLVHQAAEFITHARVGDELRARDHDGREIGGVRVMAPWEGRHVSVTIGLPTGFIDQAPRFRRLLHRAYQQFMPKATNVILIGSAHDDDQTDFENALLGSHIERWDAYPPRGKRVAHGRAEDGFWQGQRFSDSRCAGWFHFTPGASALRTRLWKRAEFAIGSAEWAMIESVFAV